MNKIQNILRFAMRMEKDAKDFYEYHAQNVKNESTKKLFLELAETEKTHYDTLSKLYDSLGYSEPPISVSWVVDNTSKAIDPSILSNNSNVYSVDQAENDIAVIRMAYLIENDFALFYKNAVPLVEEESVKEILTQLSEWEDDHKDFFYSQYQELLKKYWGDVVGIVLPK